MGPADVYAGNISTLAFMPGIHVHHHETVLPIHDGGTKMQDVREEMAISVLTLPE